MNKIFSILVFICIVYSQDIYVDSGMDYEKQYYAKFDRFTKHGGWNNYENSSKDEIKLPNNFSDFWQDNFIITSLNRGSIHRTKFDKDFRKLLFK